MFLDPPSPHLFPASCVSDEPTKVKEIKPCFAVCVLQNTYEIHIYMKDTSKDKQMERKKDLEISNDV